MYTCLLLYHQVGLGLAAVMAGVLLKTAVVGFHIAAWETIGVVLAVNMVTVHVRVLRRHFPW